MLKTCIIQIILALFALSFQVSAMGGGGIEAPRSEKKDELAFMIYDVNLKNNIIMGTKDNQDTQNKRYLRTAEFVSDETTNPADKSLPGASNENSNEIDILDTLAYGPNYDNANPYPRKFWPDVNPQAAVYAAMVSTIWLTVLSLYLYIRFSGRSYDALFNEEDSDSTGNMAGNIAAHSTVQQTAVSGSDSKANILENSRTEKKIKQVQIVGHIREEDEQPSRI